MHPVHHERHGTAAPVRRVRTDQPHARHLADAVEGDPVSSASCAATASIPIADR